jgi:hypothetical protein
MPWCPIPEAEIKVNLEGSTVNSWMLLLEVVPQAQELSATPGSLRPLRKYHCHPRHRRAPRLP